MKLPAGTFLGPYQILAPIESGGMSSVYRARDVRLGRQVALKVLPAAAMLDDSLVKRFQREARAAAALQHPNIVAVYDVGEADVTDTTPYGPEGIHVQYLVEELIEGSSLRRLIRDGRVPLRTYLEIAIGIACGLMAAHEKGLVHRDLKPENILLDEMGRPKITDFGLVHWLNPEGAQTANQSAPPALTRSGFVVGTLGYMSPEQARGDPLGPPSDIFVYGILLYELLTGVSPFAHATADEAFRAVLKTKAPPVTDRLPETPPDLVKIIERCLERNLAERYTSAGEIVTDLERLRTSLRLHDAGPERASGARAHQREHRGRYTAGVWLAGALAVVLAFAGGYAVGHGRGASPAAPRPSPPDPWHEWRAEFCGEAARDADPIEAVLSADASRIVYTAATGDDTDVFSVPIRRPETPRRISRDASGGRAPFVTADGSRVLFSAGRPERAVTGIWEAPIDGDEDPRLLVEEGEEPALSPDETQLTYVRRRAELSEIWLARRDGLFRRRILVGQGMDWRYPVFTRTGGALLVYQTLKGNAPFAGSAQLAYVPLAEPKAVPYQEARRLDPRSRPVPMNGGLVFLRSYTDRSPFLLEAHGRALRRLPFGADLTLLSALKDGRTALTRSAGGPLVLWHRQ